MAESVAVVIPAYNASRFIRTTLNAVAQQTRLPDEIIVVDDGSSDETASVVEAWIREHPLNARLIRQTNGGASVARNTGVESCGSQLIATVDADDIVLPEHVQVLASGFELEPNLVLCFGDASIHDADGVRCESFLAESEIAAMRYVEHDDLRVIQGSAFRGIVGGSRIPTSATMYRRGAAIEASLYDPAMKQCNDRDFLLRLSRVGPFGYFPVRLAQHHRHESNLTHPRHRLVNRGYKLKALRKVLRNRSQMNLSDDELARTHEAIRQTARSLLYSAADRGLRSYMKAVGTVVSSGAPQEAVSPRNLLRSLRRF